MDDSALHLLAISVGNTRTSFGVFVGRELSFAKSLVNSSKDALADAIVEAATELESAERSAVVVASVNPKVSEALIDLFDERIEPEVYRIGVDIPIPVRFALAEGTRPGVDRLLAALAAFEVAKQACVVIDAGTAITVDFIDGTGVFQGGAITPGARMMLNALHDGAAQLPEVELKRPDESEVFGKDTREAMLMGVIYTIRGGVRALVERYAEAYGGYPLVVATGGDARLLFADDELVERIADDLVLHGIAIACDVTLSGGEVEADATPGLEEE